MPLSAHLCCLAHGFWSLSPNNFNNGNANAFNLNAGNLNNNNVGNSNGARPYFHINNYNKLITNASNSMNFVASKRFTKNELPVGSLIVCQNGYQYRPEAWVDDTLQATRPDNVSVKYVEVTEAWWGNYKYRAFNISATNGASLEFQ